MKVHRTAGFHVIQNLPHRPVQDTPLPLLLACNWRYLYLFFSIKYLRHEVSLYRLWRSPNVYKSHTLTPFGSTRQDSPKLYLFWTSHVSYILLKLSHAACTGDDGSVKHFRLVAVVIKIICTNPTNDLNKLDDPWIHSARSEETCNTSDNLCLPAY